MAGVCYIVESRIGWDVNKDEHAGRSLFGSSRRIFGDMFRIWGASIMSLIYKDDLIG